MALNLLRKINLAKIGKTDLTKNVTIRVLSTENDEAAGIKEESLRYYRTAESNPLKHDERHYGRLYSVPNEEFKVVAKLEEDQNKSTFIPVKLMKRNLALEEQTYMVRQPYLELLQYLRQVNWPAQDNLRFLLWGKMGTGKSTTMSQVHHWALNSNFIVIKFHSIRRWFSNYQEAVESEFKAGRWNFPNEARAVLEDFKYYNINKIDGMVTHKTYQWSEAEMTPEGAPLSEVIESGLSRPRFSSDCLNVLLKEIKLNIQQDGWNKHPVMVIIDGINVLFQERTFVSKTKPRRKDRTIPIPKHISSACSPDELSVIVAIKHLLKNDFKNACLVASVDRNLQLDLTKRVYGENKKWWRALQQNMVPETDPDYPFALLGNHGWDQLHPFVPIATNDYTEGELDAMIDYYADKSYIKSQSTTEKGRHEIRFLTGKNPGEFHNLSAFF